MCAGEVDNLKGVKKVKFKERNNRKRKNDDKIKKNL